MFTKIRITDIKSKISKDIKVEDYSIGDLEAIALFYDNNNRYLVERI